MLYEVITVAAPDVSASVAEESADNDPAAKEGSGFLQSSQVSVPEKQTLVDLIGRAEITVLENVRNNFV